METYHVRPGSILPLGKQGENLAKQIWFDLSRWISNFGPGTVQLLHQRSGDETPYPVAVEQEGNFAVWNVTSADTAFSGTGRAELQYYVGNALAKSETWMTKVLQALGPASETPPEAQQGWVDQVLQAGTDAAEAADRAENASIRQPYPNEETGTWWVWSAEAGAYEDTGISYGTGSGGGVTDHEKLTGRDKADQHTMSAISGLEDALDSKQPKGNYLTDDILSSAIDTALAEAKESGEFDGKDGDPGQAATFEIVSTETLEPDQEAAVTETDESAPQARKYIASIPRGKQGPAGVSGVYVGDGEMPDDCNVQINPNGQIVNYIKSPSTAEVGQTVVVKAVDEEGRPTEWGAADVAGGSIAWRKICTIKLTEDVEYIEIDEDENGNPFTIRGVIAFGVTKGVTDDTTGGRSAYITAYDASGKLFDAAYTLPGVPAYGGSRGICLTAMLIPSDRIIGYGWNSSDSGTEASIVSRKAIFSYDLFRGPITKIRLATGYGGTGFGGGTALEIYGVDYA